MADDVEGQARALGRLNQLSRLGPPAGLAALERLDEMRRVFPCVATPAEVDRDVATTPQCGTCAFALADHATRADARLTVRAIERALKTQLSRLSLRLVSRILARPQSGGPEKLEQFLRVVQASDLEGLASILDDSLLAFVADLLASDEGGENVLADLSLAYPTVTAANLEAALGEFRRLLLVRFAAGQEAVPLLRAGA